MRLPKLEFTNSVSTVGLPSRFTRTKVLVFIAAFAIAGSILLLATRAATPFASLEPEQGTKIAGANNGSDSTTSGGQYVQFGSGPTQPANLFVAVGGSGNCTQGSPCGSINAALARASSGSVIELAAGTYPQQNLTGTNSWSTNVVVRPAIGAVVILGGIDVKTPHVTVMGMTASFASLGLGADFGRLENMTIQGTTYLSADNTAVIKSRLGPQDGNDTLKLGGNNVLIEDNYMISGHRTSPDQHLDVVQVNGMTNLIFRRNIVQADYDSQGMQIGQEFSPNNNLLFENNVFHQCPASNPNCGSFYVTSGAGTNVRYINNTIKGGLYPDNAVYSGNIIGYAGCDSTRPQYKYNLIENPAFGPGCDASNKRGKPVYISDGYHLATGSPGINFGVPANFAATEDIDKVLRNCGLIDAGADENC